MVGLPPGGLDKSLPASNNTYNMHIQLFTISKSRHPSGEVGHLEGQTIKSGKPPAAVSPAPGHLTSYKAIILVLARVSSWARTRALPGNDMVLTFQKLLLFLLNS